jgi:amino acid transporter
MKIFNFIFSFVFIIKLFTIFCHKKHNLDLTHKVNKNKPTCDDIPCPESKGLCNLDNECSCFGGYVTYLPNLNITQVRLDKNKNDDDSNGLINLDEIGDSKNNKTQLYQCNYVQSSQMTAFLLEFLISFGVGHFYVGKWIIGTIKFIFCASFIIVFFALPYLSAKYRAFTLNKLTPYLQCLAVMLFCVWQIVDAILYGMNYYKDNNRVDLKSW